MKKALFISFILILAVCSSAKVTSFSQSNESKVTSNNSENTMSGLDQGKSLFEKHCGTCHALKDPSKYTETEWNIIVP